MVLKKLRARIFKKRTQIGVPILSFSEKAKVTGGFVSVSDPSVPSGTPSSQVPTGTISRSGGGVSSSVTPKPTPTPKQISKLTSQQISKLPQTQQRIQQQRIQQQRIQQQQQRIRKPIIPFIRPRQQREIKKPIIDISVTGKKSEKEIKILFGRLNIASKELDESQDLLNKDISIFNEKFTGKELGEEEFKQAEISSSNLEEKQKRIEEGRKQIEETRAKRFPKIKKFIGKVKEEKIELQDERTKRVFERHDIPATPENLFLARSMIKEKEDVASKDFEFLLLGAMTTPRAIVKGVPKPSKIKVTPTRISRIKLAIKKLTNIETKIRGDPTKPSLDKLRAISKARNRLKAFEKQLLKSKKQIPLSKKIFKLKPSKLKLRKIKARRKKFRKITKVKETTKQIQKLKEERLKKILERRKKLAEFNKKLGLEKKIKKFKKVKLKRILKARKRLAKFKGNKGVREIFENIKKLEKEIKLKRTRKRLAKFKVKKGIRDIFENVREIERQAKLKQTRIRIKRRTTKRAIRRIKRIPFQRIKLRKKVPDTSFIKKFKELSFSDLTFKGKKLGKFKIKTQKDFNTIREFIGRRGSKKFSSNVWSSVGLEPQVSKAVKTLLKKGYKTISSGFTPETLKQHILIDAKKIPSNLNKIAKKLNIKISKVINPFTSKPFPDRIQFTINQQGKSLRDIERIFTKFSKEAPKFEIPVQKIKLTAKVPKPTITFQKIKPKGISVQRIKPTTIKGNVRQQLLKSPQEFRSRVIQSLKSLTPEQQANLKRLIRKAKERRFNLNNELIKQGKNVKLTDIQKQSLQRGREQLQKLNKNKNNIGNSLKRIAVEEEKVKRRISTLQKSRASQELINKQKFKQKQLSKERFKQRNNQKSIQKQLANATQKSLSSLLALSLFRQAQISKQGISPISKIKQAQKLRIKQAQAQAQKIKPRIKQPQKAKQKIKTRLRLRRKIPVVIKFKKKLRLPKKKIKAQQLYNTFARPIKKRRGQSRPKLLKVNKVPLTKIQAKRLGSTIVDSTLSRTFKIKKVGKAKPKKAKLKTRSFQKHKFRRHRIVKGKRKRLKNIFIEKKGRFLIDTVGEKRGLTLRRGLKQLEKRSGFKPQKRKQVRITTKKKTSLSQAQLSALAKGRAKRMSNLKKKR